MGSLGYDKWSPLAAPGDEDEEDPPPCVVVRKQACHVVPTSGPPAEEEAARARREEERKAKREAQRKAEHAAADEEGARLEAKMNELMRKMQEAQAAARQACESDSESSGEEVGTSPPAGAPVAPVAEAAEPLVAKDTEPLPPEVGAPLAEVAGPPAPAAEPQSEEMRAAPHRGGVEDAAQPSSAAAPPGEERQGDGDSPPDAEASVASAVGTPQGARRRGLDRLWEVAAERDFELREPPDGGRGEEIAAAFRKAAEEGPKGGAAQAPPPQQQEEAAPAALGPPPGTVPVAAPEVAAIAAAGAAGRREQQGSDPTASSASSASSSLRRVKQLDAETAGAISLECGVNVSRSDAFRLVLETPQSSLKGQTRVLIVTASDSFLCTAPISEEECAAEERTAEEEARPVTSADDEVAPEAVGGAVGSRSGSKSGSLAEGADTAGRMTSVAGNAVVVELCFFHAAPKHKSLAQKLGRLPTLHIRLSTDDSAPQCMEFIGIHQRRYLAEETPGDAISQHLVESLLLVVLEFVFHPSRSKYNKEHLILRECSVDKEVRQRRKHLLPQMVEKVRLSSGKIRTVSVEFCDSPPPMSGASASGGKERSFFVFDEDVLKVAPVKESMMTKQPSTGKFEKLQQGFLNSKKAKKQGLSAPSGAGTQDSTSPAASAPPPAGPDGSSASEAPQESRKLPLPAADLESRLTDEAKAIASQGFGAARRPPAADGGAAAQPGEWGNVEEEDDTSPAGGGPQSLNELANQLFGDLALDEDVEGLVDEGMTESTNTPSSLKAASSREGGAGPTSSSASAEQRGGGGGGEAAAGEAAAEGREPRAAGIRLLQQRRRAQAAAVEGVAATGSGSRPAGAQQPAAQPAKDESDELIKLWMKQRW